MAAKNHENQGSGAQKEGAGEKGIRWYRNFNAAVGGIALVGAAIAPPLAAAPLAVYGGFNVAQAGGAEVARRYVKKRRVKK